jgi:hypothetical protein
MAALTDQTLTVSDRAGTEVKDVAKMTPVERHRRLMSWFDQEMRRQSHNRFQMALDEDYYDSIQWQADEAAEVKARGQNPVVYNETKPMIDWLIGVERRTRVDFKVYSRDGTPEGDNDAQVKTKLLKYLQDVNRTPSSARRPPTTSSRRAGLDRDRHLTGPGRRADLQACRIVAQHPL